MIIIDDDFILSQVRLVEIIGFDNIFNYDSYDVLIEFVYSKCDDFKNYISDITFFEFDPVFDFCKANIYEFVYFVCLKYSDLSDFIQGQKYRLQAEVLTLIESNNIRFMNELRHLIKDDYYLSDILSDNEFCSRCKSFLLCKRLS